MNKGYLEDPIYEEDWRLGAAPLDVLQKDRDWRPYLPLKELQNRNRLETQACVSFGTNSALEMLFKRVYNFEPNFSDRYTAIRTGTTRQGNSPHHVAEVIRNYIGGIPELILPFSDNLVTFEDYYRGVTTGMKLNGLIWLKDWEINHEWVHDTQDVKEQNEAIWDALQTSPIGVAVDAWNKDYGFYHRTGKSNHWCVIVHGVKDQYWVIWDSYDNTLKTLVWDYGFDRAKRYRVQKRTDYSLQFKIRAFQGYTGLF